MAKKQQKKKKATKKIYELYDNGKAKNPTCPKCGPGVFMADHHDRYTCGKCGYSEFKKK
ncbi:MAG: ubiquitin-small subunit ribosomal protein S27Ae [Candidatus Woesearchaeota archaeon]|nr:ubiquitin-small subunit ribosomal protein S27Ae [Candidatus Woesearchaeota archaeon]